MGMANVDKEQVSNDNDNDNMLNYIIISVIILFHC